MSEATPETGRAGEGYDLGLDEHGNTIVDGIVIHCKASALMTLDQITPHPLNPNRHPAGQISLLAQVIRRNGWRVPLVVSARSNYLIRGQGRLEAAKKLGMNLVPVDVQEYADEEAEFADMIADNKIPELASMDLQVVSDLLDKMPEWNPTELGFTDSEMTKLLEFTDPPAEESDAGEPEEEIEEGEDTRAGRFIVLYFSEDQKKAYCKALGIDGRKVVYDFEEVQLAGSEDLRADVESGGDDLDA